MELLNSYISGKYDRKKKLEPLKPPQNALIRYFVKSPSNPPQQPIIKKVELMKVWQGKPLYLVEYSNQFPAILTSLQMKREMPQEELA